MTVRDPNFWKRFSVAVHQDDVEKQHVVDSKQSYVISLEEMPSPEATTPTSPMHMLSTTAPTTTPAPAPAPALPRQPSPVVLPPQALEQPRSPTTALPPAPPSPKLSETSHKPDRRSRFSFVPRSGSLPFSRHGNGSQMTLAFSGRPQSRFKFWTSISADPPNRDSWLESQRRKQRHRTWICWIFWVSLFLVIGIAVAVVLVLKKFDIIKI